MNRFLSAIYKLICLIMLVFFGYVYFGTLGNLSHMPIINTYIGEKWAILFTWIGAATLFIVLYSIQKILFKIPQRTRNFVLLCLCILGVFLQFYMILGIRPCLRYDSLNPVDTAVALLKGIPFSSTASYEYFTIYPHNLPLTGYTTLLLKIASLLGISEGNYIIFLQLLNCLFIDLSIFSLFMLIRKKASEHISCFFLLLCLTNPLIYYYPTFFYTQVLCMPVITILIVLFFKLMSDISPKERLLYSALYGIVLFLGWKIRVLSLIAPIACVIFLFLKQNLQFIKKENFLPGITIFLCSFLICIAGNKILLSSYGLNTDKEKAFPVHHWLMMGLENEGNYNLADELFTLGFETKSERIIENSKVIKQRLQYLGFSGVLRLWGAKLTNTWSDGYDDYSDNLMLSKHYRNYNDYLSGDRSEPLAGYLHIYNSMVWALITLCTCRMLLQKKPSFIYVICLSLVGGMIFHLFWEAGEAYSMPFALLIIAGAASGFELTNLDFVKKIASKQYILLVPTTILLGGLLLFFHLKPTLFNVSFRTKEWAAVQDISKDDYLFLKEGDTFTQTFSSSRPFNRLTLQYKYISESEGNAKALLQLTDGKGVCIYEQFLLTETYFNGWTFELPTIKPDGYETYTIQITAMETPSNSSWAFAAYNTGVFDVYPDGFLSINNIKSDYVDLTFHVYNDTRRTFFS